MARLTLAEVLAQAKKERNKIQKKAIKKVEDLIPPVISGVMPLGPEIVRGIVEVENALMDYAIDRLSAEAGHIPIGPQERRQRTFDPDNPITKFLQDLEFPKRRGRPPSKGPPIPKFKPTIPGPQEDGGFFTPEQAAEWDRKVQASPAIARKRRSDAQLVNDQIQRTCLQKINKRARKKDGSFKKGWSQQRIMRTAQKECTKERIRLKITKGKRKRGSRSR